jgi:hypothetical protein
VTDKDRLGVVDGAIRVDHDMRFVKGGNAGFKFERDERRINTKVVKGRVVNRNRREFVLVMVDTSA